MLTVFEIRGIPNHRRERIEMAVVVERVGDAAKADDRP
jgi:hypothetical protein